jgi:hypothetical protein
VVRRYDDPVEVHAADADGSGGSEPASFLWRGRLYVVREVLGHWRERRAWWTASAACALHGETDPVSADRVGEGPAGRSSLGAAGGPVRSVTCSALGEEREVWRVEASRGRFFSSGVYDLCRELSTSASDVTGAWRLLAVAD